MTNESLSQTERSTLPVRRVAKVAGAMGGFIVLLLCRSFLPEAAAASLLTAWGVVTGALCGIPWGIALTIAAAVGDGWLSPPGQTASMVGFTIRWSTTIALVVWISRQQVRLQTEHRRARLDPLTGLPNRQAFFERCAAELSRVKRFDRPLTVMLLDGDDFKLVNDQHGHARGDLALQQTARTLVASVRPYDLVCRLGGDEFVLLFPETVAADAARIAARLQQSLENQLSDEFAPLSFSIGAITVLPPAVQDPAWYLAEADQVLYAAKRAGKKTIRSTVISVANPVPMRDNV